MDNKKAAEILRAIKIGTAHAFLNDDAITSALDTAIDVLEKQEQDRWVPVSERPKKDGRYQVTRLDYVTDTKFIDNLWYEKNTWWNRQVTGDYAVTAWRPLPEPYTEDEA